MIQGFESRCVTCDAEYNISVKDATAKQVKAQKANRTVWADTHYSTTGHHRFVHLDSTALDVDVAKIRDPNQLTLAEDPNYETFRLGSSGD